MSRAFGNRLLKQYVVAEPEIQVIYFIRRSHTLGRAIELNVAFYWFYFSHSTFLK